VNTTELAVEGSAGKCCFNGCGDPSSCNTDYRTTKEQRLAPQAAPGGGCVSSPPHGHGAKPSWCPGLAAPIAVKTMELASDGSSGKCCFNGCGDLSSCKTDYCTTKEECLAPQGAPGGGCDSSPPRGHGAKPSWGPGLAVPITVNTTELASEGSAGKCCFNGCGDPSSCKTDYCTTKEQCLAPQGAPGGGCDSSLPHGHGAKPSWCPGLAAPLAVVENASPAADLGSNENCPGQCQDDPCPPGVYGKCDASSH